MKIGSFAATTDGFAGQVSTLYFSAKLMLVRAEPRASDKAPDYRVIEDGADGAREIGAGWKKASAKAGDYIALQIDDPGLACPLRANLFAGDDGAYHLLWSRAKRRDATR